MFRFGRLRPALSLVAATLALSGCADTLHQDDYSWGRPGPAYPAPSSGWYGSGYGSSHGHGRPPWVRNGRCDDDRYQTSNGGAAPAGEDEYDCLLFGNGLKSGRVKNEGAFARNGVCDDPAYVVTTGRAKRGTDEYDCTRLGDGLRGKHVRGGYPPYVAGPDRPSQPVHQPRPQPPQPTPQRPDPPAPESGRPEYRGRNVVIQHGGETQERARRDAEQEQAQAEAAARRAEEERQRAEEERARRDAEQEQARAEAAARRAEEERQRAEDERQRAEVERQRAEQERARPIAIPGGETQTHQQ